MVKEEELWSSFCGYLMIRFSKVSDGDKTFFTPVATKLTLD